MTGVITGNAQWAYVAAAYGLTALVTGLVVLGSWRGMRAAEKRSDALKKQRRGD